jgi:hypothetical protein
VKTGSRFDSIETKKALLEIATLAAAPQIS